DINGRDRFLGGSAAVGDRAHCPFANLPESLQFWSQRKSDVLAFEIDGAFSRISEPDEQPARGGLTATALASEAENLALSQPEANAVNRFYGQLIFREEGLEEALLEWIVLLQALYADQIFFAQIDQLVVEMTCNEVIAPS